MEIIKNDKPDVATSNFRIAFNEVWYDQLCLMRAWVTLGTIFNSPKYTNQCYNRIHTIQLKVFYIIFT